MNNIISHSFEAENGFSNSSFKNNSAVQGLNVTTVIIE